jgi:hypothetical protein
VAIIFPYPELIGTIETLDGSPAVNVTEVSSNSGCVDNIEEGQMSHQGGLLQQQGQGLSNTTASTADGDFGIVLKDGMTCCINVQFLNQCYAALFI